MKAIINGKIILPDEIVTGKALVYDTKIVGIVDANTVKDAEIIDAKGAYVAPGLVDMHIHGYLGEDSSDGKKDGVVKMSEGVAKNGVTSWLPTTMTVSYDELRAAFKIVRELMPESRKASWKGAEILGVNSEGPFINPAKKGAQSEEHIKPCDPAFIKEYQDVIRVFTVAPEMPGNMDAIREIARDTNVLISMGHTSADFDTAQEAVKAGVRHVTHLFNAQTPLAHRDPGVVGCALMSDNVTTELIADTFHVNKALFKLVARMKGDHLVLITDCTRAGGMPDGEYTLGGQPIYVKGIECRLANGTIAGSVLKLNHAIKNFMDNTDLPLNEIVTMASLSPAKAIHADDRKGSLEAGKDADIILADKDFEIKTTILRGNVIYQA